MADRPSPRDSEPELDGATHCPLAIALAANIRENRLELTHRWLERIAARVNLDPNRIFPSDALLDHVPILVDGIADYLADPAREIAAEMPVVSKAMELGALRHRQGFDVYEVLKEYELLGGILFSHLVAVTARLEVPCAPGELLGAAQRLFRAVAIIQQTTVTHFLELAQERVREREQRLQAFNRALSHELKNRIGAILGAADLLLTLDQLAPDERSRFARIVTRNARDMEETIANLLDLTRLDGDQRQQRHVELPEAAAETVRRLRDAAEARGVEIVVDELPSVEVNAAAVELALTNYISNAIKYSEPARDERWVRVSGALHRAADDGQCEIEVRVTDNGRGVPEPARPQLFERFFRAHEQVAGNIEGTGLGLSIVRETVEAMGGRAWAEFPADGAVFAFTIPCRRSRDRAPEREVGVEVGAGAR